MKPAAGGGRKPMDLAQVGVPRGEVHIIAERCKECSYCIVYCPEKVLVYSEDTNARGYHYPILSKDTDAECVLCKFCDLICPELAIFTTDPGAAEQDS